MDLRDVTPAHEVFRVVHPGVRDEKGRLESEFLQKRSDKCPVRLHRVIDESGEDYLYPANYFAPIELPPAIRKAVLSAA